MLKKIRNKISRIIYPEQNKQINTNILNYGSGLRFLYQKRLLDTINDLDGDIVECGVGVGSTLLMWAILVFDERKNRRIWGFDSFEGFPEPTKEDVSPRNPKKGEWNYSTIKSINDLIINAGFPPDWARTQITLVKGFFNESLSKYIGEKIALLHLDVDLYQSYNDSLEALYDKVQPGGVIAFDEYMSTYEYLNFPGARKAIDGFFENKNVKIIQDKVFGKYYTIKPKK
jgi:hypothetical protein